MLSWGVLYGLLTAMTLVVAASAERGVEVANLTGTALAISATFVASAAVAVAGAPHAPTFTAIDGAALFWFGAHYHRTGRAALLAVAILLAFQIAEHVRYAFDGDFGRAARYAYLRTLNETYFLQLCCVAFPALNLILERKPGRGRSSASRSDLARLLQVHPHSVHHVDSGRAPVERPEDRRVF